MANINLRFLGTKKVNLRWLSRGDIWNVVNLKPNQILKLPDDQRTKIMAMGKFEDVSLSLTPDKYISIITSRVRGVVGEDGILNVADIDDISPEDIHRHSNKGQLDQVTDGDHDVRVDNPHDVGASNIVAETPTGKFLKDDGTWDTAGGGTPAGADKTVQFNDNGSFGSVANMTFDGTDITIANGTDLIPLGSLAQSVKIGSGATAGYQSTAIGHGATATADEAYSGAIAIGYQSESSYSSLALGISAYAKDFHSVSIGLNAKVKSGAYESTVIGHNATADSYNNVSIGSNTRCYSYDGVALGNSAKVKASAYNSIAIGNADADAHSTVAIGGGSYAKSSSSVALGVTAKVETGSPYSVSLGNNTRTDSSCTNSTAVGAGASVATPYGTALGSEAQVTSAGTLGTAVGRGARVDQANGIALGYGANTDAANQLIISRTTTITNVKFGTGYHAVTFANPLTLDITTAGSHACGSDEVTGASTTPNGTIKVTIDGTDHWLLTSATQD